MIKLIRCLKRRSDVSAEEFRKYWNAPEYIDLIEKLTEMTQFVDCTRSLTLQIEINSELANLYGTQEPFDGVIEVTWRNSQALMAFRNTEDGLKSIDEMLAFEDQFVDRTASRYFFTE